MRGIGRWLRENPLKSVLLLVASGSAACLGTWGVGGAGGFGAYLVFQGMKLTPSVALLQGGKS